MRASGVGTPSRNQSITQTRLTFHATVLRRHFIQVASALLLRLRHTLSRYALHGSQGAISTDTQADIFWTFTDSAWNTIFKIVFLGTSGYTLYVMLNDYKPTHDPNLDTFKVNYLLGGSAILAILFPIRYTFTEILWAFSIWLESVAILPQLFMLQRTGEAETITTHYLFALGLYRALYIPNWIYRYFAEGWFEPRALLAGIIQTILYSDFFWVYYTK
jgi:ER lumen protein retaining receptor